LSHILNIPYLLLDGLGEENVTSWSRDEVLLTILSYRDINHLPTFVTSMYTIDELKDVYLLRKNDKTEKIRAQKIALKIKSLCTQLSLESNKK
jgi:DNA replication protein DnaC